jgi:hypothetical protein
MEKHYILITQISDSVMWRTAGVLFAGEEGEQEIEYGGGEGEGVE